MTDSATSPCRTCGAPIPRTRRTNGGLAAPTRYCSNDCKPRCSVSHCGKPHYAGNLCCMHYNRVRRNGDPGPPTRTKPSRPPGLIGYMAAHKRVYKTRGSAANYPCANLCGQQAHQWSYNHQAGPREHAQLMDGTWLYFSPDPTDYDPFCRSCHTHYDRGNSPNWAPDQRLPPQLDPVTGDVIITRQSSF